MTCIVTNYTKNIIKLFTMDKQLDIYEASIQLIINCISFRKSKIAKQLYHVSLIITNS